MPSRQPSTYDEPPAAAPTMTRLANPRKPARLAIVLAAALAAGGCAQLNNPWKDSSANIDAEMTTPSAEGHTGRSEFGRQRQRKFAERTVYYENGTVTHWPLWWEDPFEDKGNGFKATKDEDEPDTEYAWNWVDYFDVAYSPGRFIVNTLAWPISAIVTPPGTVMESDGRIGKGLLFRDHDAQRAPPDRAPPDVAPDRSKPVQDD